MLLPHPKARLAATGLALLGTLLMRDPVAMALLWAGVLVPIVAAGRIMKPYGQFLLTILLPIALALALVWGVIVAAPPGAEMGSNRHAGLLYAAAVVLRLALLGGILQVCFLTIPPNELPYTLSQWGLRGDAMVVALGVYALLPELRTRTSQVLVARSARGLVPNRSLLSNAKQLPFLLRPLFAWALRAAIQRSEHWRQRQLLSRVERLSADSSRVTSRVASVAIVSLAAVWFLLGVAGRAAGIHF